MSSTDNLVSNPQTFKSLGQVAKQIGISRPYLSERLNTECPRHKIWPALQRINGSYNPLAYAIAARLVKLTPRPIYEIDPEVSPENVYSTIDAIAWALARVVGAEENQYHHPRLERKELVFFLRAIGDALTATLDGLERPKGYGDIEPDEPTAEAAP